MSEFAQVVHARRSIRLFRPDKPVPRSYVIEALELARRAPSNSNSQPRKPRYRPRGHGEPPQGRQTQLAVL
jgi:nitroreductase